MNSEISHIWLGLIYLSKLWVAHDLVFFCLCFTGGCIVNYLLFTTNMIGQNMCIAGIIYIYIILWVLSTCASHVLYIHINTG